jgi:hypothetical protein
MSDPTSAHKPYTTGARPLNTVAQKKNIIATGAGWVRQQDSDSYKFYGNDNPLTTPEVIVAIRNLAARLTPLISGFTWTSPVGDQLDKSAGGTLSIVTHFSQAVVVTGSPTLTVTNGNEGSGAGRGPDVLVYASGTTTEELTFSLVVAAGSGTHNANDILHINAANIISLAGGTIKAVSDAEVATITSTAALGNDAGSILVVA